MEQENKDAALWKIAKRRAMFKYHVLIYFIMNLFFWTLWYISLKNNPSLPDRIDRIPWPVWPMVAWGLGVFFIYLGAYKSQGSVSQKEYDKLKNKQ